MIKSWLHRVSEHPRPADIPPAVAIHRKIPRLRESRPPLSCRFAARRLRAPVASRSSPDTPFSRPLQEDASMKIHEYQGKELLRQFGVPVPRGYPAFTVQEAVEAAQKLGGSVWVVKAQIHAGGRGKGGGVKLARSMDDLKKLAGEILGMQLKTHQTGPEGQKVRRLYIEEGADIKKEYYVSLVTDRATQKVAFIASSEGGMDIEEVAHSTPEKIITDFIDPLTGLGAEQAKKIAASSACPKARTRRPSTCSRSSTSATWTPTPRWSRSTRSTATARATWSRSTRSSTSTRTRCSAIPRSSPTATSTKKIRPRSKPRSSTWPTSAWTATSVAWSTARAWPWPRWTPSSCSAASRPTSWTSAAAPRPSLSGPRRRPRP